MGNNSAVEHIENELAIIEDPDERRRALISVVSKLMDKGLVTFPAGETAGYLDTLETTSEGHLEEIDKAISELMGEAVNIGANRGGYARTEVPTDMITKDIFRGKVPFDKPKTYGIIPAKKARDGVEKNVSVLLHQETGAELKSSSKSKEDIVRTFVGVIERLTEEDKRVFVAVGNLTNGGVFRATPTQLFRAAHMSPDAKPTEDQLARLDESIRKMACIYIKLDVKQLLEDYPEMQRVQAWFPVGANFVDVREFYGRTANGSYSEYYEFNGKPILFDYAQILTQVERIEAGERSPYTFAIRKTKENEVMVTELADRVCDLKGARKTGKSNRVANTITFKKLFAGVDYSRCKSDAARYNKKSRKKTELKKQLNFLKTAGLIEGYNMTEDGVEVWLGGEA